LLGAACGAETPAGEASAPPPAAAAPAGAHSQLLEHVSKACVEAGFTAGSAEHRQCGLDLIQLLRTFVAKTPVGTWRQVGYTWRLLF